MAVYEGDRLVSYIFAFSFAWYRNVCFLSGFKPIHFWVLLYSTFQWLKQRDWRSIRDKVTGHFGLIKL